MPITQTLLKNQNKKIEYGELIEKYPWITKKSKDVVLSPDSDGFLCGLLMTNYLKSRIVGFYDGKILLIKNGVKAENCIFVDFDINRKNICSIGHHIVNYNKSLKEIPNYNYTNCIQPNIIRNFDGKGEDFQRKYPFGTIHLLLGIYQKANIVQDLSSNSLWPLLFTDGVWINLFSYTENCIDWINFLKIVDNKHILHPLVCSNSMNFYQIMLGLNKFLRMRDLYNAKGYFDGRVYKEEGRNKRTGDKLKISNSKGKPINLVKDNLTYKIHDLEKNRIIKFISEMGKYINWNYLPSKWTWENFKLYRFEKEDFSKRKLNNKTYLELMKKNPLSLAMTSGQNIEYTLEKPDKLP